MDQVLCLITYCLVALFLLAWPTTAFILLVRGILDQSWSKVAAGLAFLALLILTVIAIVTMKSPLGG